MKTKKETLEIIDILSKYYGEYKCGLHFKSPFELLIATILSAQCTDERVNIVTEKLFKEANTPSEILEMGEKELLKYIKSCGLSNTKSKNIIKTCFTLCNEYNEEVPKTMEELIKLNGVGRKTANVVLSNAFGVPAIAVDTHVQRVSNRIGLANSDDVLKTEQSLMKKIPKEYWSNAHHWIIWHGRKICTARNPKCEECPLNSLCNFYKKNSKKNKKKEAVI
ncbi:endonuclease III [Anaerofustis stercorihominis]|uniref:Endonuclease III n=2 Tax=Anaerofustis stercorihominis TaxID=214853 RepID=B1C9B2_9FIRM|nr:endonuclease III [Anaerofustis stercorihominis]EDS72276.1 endonuclease III [Anaerofustis stercorihominis DSM 17244]MCQ4795126.1 endonuclease III [Anaerofustis stercorihominis]RGD73182.1 endonuclease III [Anaerofustis stercorihominis]